ncbi:MAG TPA: Ig-like domain-containing protein, partial [Anaerolineales bacterium]|nr:Ig-like domain-containing protein [Anaerolineales bacterium]
MKDLPSFSGKRRLLNVVVILALLLSGFPIGEQPALADGIYQSLPYTQDWSNTGLITINDDWSGVPGVIGYRGDALTSVNDVNPQTVLGQESPLVVDVNVNQTNPNTFATGGVAEFHLANPVVALNGSGTADAPYVVFHINTTGFSSINVSYNLRDLDGSIDNAVQQVALQYRIGDTGNFTNVPAGYVADATTGPSLATLVTPVNVTLPAAADNQTQLQIRVITTNATGNDEWVGIDDVSITGSPIVVDAAPEVSSTFPSNGSTNFPIDANLTVTFSEPVDVTSSWFELSCSLSGIVTASFNGGPTTFTLDPSIALAHGENCTLTIYANQVSDQDSNDPPDNMVVNFTVGFMPFDVCASTYTPIYSIQGSGLAAAITGNVTTQGVVVGDYEGPSPTLRGFYVQDLNGDGDPAT